MKKIWKKYSHVYTFVFLQGVSYLFGKQYQSISDNFLVNGLQYAMQQIHILNYNFRKYFTLIQNNKHLQKENINLKELLMQHNISYKAIIPKNKPLHKQYIFTVANVVYHTIHKTKNYILINKGKKEGIEKNMGVITHEGIVGIVGKVWENHAKVISILHTNILLSAKIDSSDTIGTIKWFGKNTNQIHLLYIPRHVPIELHSKVVTSGYSTIFPSHLPIGKISKINLPNHASFYDIQVHLYTPFHKLKHVYILKKRKIEDYDKWIQNDDL